MKPIDPILTAIAAEHLGIATLETRRSDSLDFHSVSVWCVRAALKAAYTAGTRALLPAAEQVIARWESGDLAEAVRSLAEAVAQANAL